MKYLITVVSLCMLVAGMGCIALSQLVTPVPELDTQAITYVVDSGIADANEYKGYQNLYKALKLDKDVDIAHNIYQFNYTQLIEKDNHQYSIFDNLTDATVDVGMAREEALFGETGLLSMGLSLLGVGGMGTIIGLMRKRPQDWTKEEVSNVLQVKDKRTKQIIVGISEFMHQYQDNEDVILALKAACDKAQDNDTKLVVKELKGV